jgi:hypothetical protein
MPRGPTLLSSGWFIRHAWGLTAEFTLDRFRYYSVAAAEDPVWFETVAVPRFEALALRKGLTLLGHDLPVTAVGDAEGRNTSEKVDVAAAALFPSASTALDALLDDAIRPQLLPGDAVIVLRFGHHGLSAAGDSVAIRGCRNIAERAGAVIIDLHCSTHAETMTSFDIFASSGPHEANPHPYSLHTTNQRQHVDQCRHTALFGPVECILLSY